LLSSTALALKNPLALKEVNREASAIIIETVISTKI